MADNRSILFLNLLAFKTVVFIWFAQNSCILIDTSFQTTAHEIDEFTMVVLHQLYSGKLFLDPRLLKPQFKEKYPTDFNQIWNPWSKLSIFIVFQFSYNSIKKCWNYAHHYWVSGFIGTGISVLLQKYFYNKRLKYMWQPDAEIFERIKYVNL